MDMGGPQITCSTPNLFSEIDLFKMGSFFYLAIGQGDTWNFGLYELPIPNHPSQHAFIYAFEVMDPDNQDPRYNGKNYCLITIVTPKSLREHLPHPFQLETRIREFLIPHYKLEDFHDPFILHELLNATFKDKKWNTSTLKRIFSQTNTLRLESISRPNSAS